MQTKVLKINKDFPEPEIIKQAVEILQKGGLVAFPTETVYGLAANFKNEGAVNKLYEVKNRPKDKPFSFLVSSVKDIDNFSYDVLPAVYRLADKFWPGPLTLVLKSKENPSKDVGLRMPKSNTALEIIRGVDFPIVCPSANLSGNREPLSAQDVLEDLEGKIDLVLDGANVELGIASTVIEAVSLPFKILRNGFIEEEKIQEVYSKKRILFVCTGNTCRSIMAKEILEKKLKEKNRKDIEVFSAGVTAAIGLEASTGTKEILKEEGIDVSSHHTQRVNEDMLKRSDLILVMERFQENFILAINPSLQNRVYLLKEFSQFTKNGLEIKDPIGEGTGVYKMVLAEIKEIAERLLELI